MKIGDARNLYSTQLHAFWNQKVSLAKQKKELEQKMKANPGAKEQYAEEAATLELSYDAVTKKYDEYHNFMEQIMEMHTAYFNAEASKQQGEALEEAAVDLAKIMEVARRIAKGAKVPSSDERKLMEYSMELYMSCKNMAVLNELKEKEEYESLWGDEEEDNNNPDPNDVANNAEVNFDAPEIVDAGDVMASAGEGESSG
jgi:hypothetical protein